MHRTQKLALLLGLMMVVAMVAFPPWKERGPAGEPLRYAPIFSPPEVAPDRGEATVDLVRLFIQVGFVFTVTGSLISVGAQTPSGGERQEGGEAGSLKGSEPQFKVIELPADISCGQLLVESDENPDFWEHLTELQGEVRWPTGRRLQLDLKGRPKVDLSVLALLPPQSLYSLDLSDCGVRDSELSDMKQLTTLVELDLSGTPVSSEALEHLRGFASLERLWLDGTGVDDTALHKLERLKSLKKVSLKQTGVSADGIRQLQKALPDCTIEH